MHMAFLSQWHSQNFRAQNFAGAIEILQQTSGNIQIKKFSIVIQTLKQNLRQCTNTISVEHHYPDVRNARYSIIWTPRPINGVWIMIHKIAINRCPDKETHFVI